MATKPTTTVKKRPAMPGAGRPTKVQQLARMAQQMADGALVTPTKNRPNRKPKPRAEITETSAPIKTNLASKKAAARFYAGQTLGALQNGELHPDATPLDVMIEAMRQAYKIGGAILAAPYAKEAAPYVHGKINPIDLKQVPRQTEQGAETPVKDMGLHRFLVEYVDTVDVDAKEVPDGNAST